MEYDDLYKHNEKGVEIARKIQSILVAQNATIKESLHALFYVEQTLKHGSLFVSVNEMLHCYTSERY